MNNRNDHVAEITLVNFEETGQPADVKQIDFSEPQFSEQLLQLLEDRLKHLSGDLDLPLEGHLPGPKEEIAFRVSSDLQNSFAFYYLDSQIIGLTLTLTGGDPEPEAEMIDSIRVLLLDQDDHEELDNEQVQSILASKDFAFQKFDQRPIHFFVPLAADTEGTISELTRGSLHLAKALCQTAGSSNSLD